MLYYTNRATTLRYQPRSNSKINRYPIINDIVVDSGDIVENGFRYVSWYKVAGWIDCRHLTEYFPTAQMEQEKVMEYDVNPIPMRPSQYVPPYPAVNKRTENHNLCGEFAAARLMGMDTVMTLLNDWVNGKNAARAKYVLLNDTGTGVPDLLSMFALYSIPVESFVLQGDSKYPTSEEVSKIVPAIIGVKIDSFGRIKSTGSIAHWVTVEAVDRIDKGLFLRGYNSMTNKYETWQLDEIGDIVNFKRLIGVKKLL